MSAPAHSPEEAAWMAAALDAAKRAQAAGEVPVGAVVVLDGEIIGSGHNTTEESDDPSGHAEINALRRAGDAAHGATAYVTLEPCNHTGRTGPCSEALIEAGVRRVVIGRRDPHASAAGGMDRLREAGIEVTLVDPATGTESKSKRFFRF